MTQSIKSELRSYSEDVLSGKVVACQKHKWACQRFVRDLERENTEGFPYVWIESKAERFFTWMSLFKHRKGVLKGKPIDPAIIQKFVFGNVYGWYHADTGYRRFTKLYWQVARKNAKSQSLACVGSYELMAFDEAGEEASEVYCAATKTEQAKIVYGETVAMLDGCAALKGRYKVAYGRIEHIKTGSVMRPLSEEDRKTGDGLNPQCGIIDEYHAHETSEVYDVIDSGMGARSQPLLAIITTAGFDLNNPCYRVEYDLISKILNPDIPVDLDSYFVMVNELDKDEKGDLIDDIKDSATWAKANPIICSYPEGRDYLSKKLEEAQEAPEKMRNFLTKHMNVWVNQRECGYMLMDRWAACGITTGTTNENQFVDVNGMDVFAGVDLSAKLDLTSVAFDIPLDDDRYAILSHSFLPEETLGLKSKTDNVPYQLWVNQGWITVTPGAEVDYHFVLDYIVDTYKKYGWVFGELCFDAAMATWLTHEANELGFTPVEIPQSYSKLTEPTKDFRAKVYNKKIIHDNNPVLTWAISNAVTRVGPSGNILLDKGRSKERIDPIAAVINAHTRAMVREFVVYNERGMRSL